MRLKGQVRLDGARGHQLPTNDDDGSDSSSYPVGVTSDIFRIEQIWWTTSMRKRDGGRGGERRAQNNDHEFAENSKFELPVSRELVDFETGRTEPQVTLRTRV